MRLFLFGVSVFYLLGLKLTLHIELKSSLCAKPAIIESKAFPEIKQNDQSIEKKPELIKKDTTISAETKSVRPNEPTVSPQKNQTFPHS